MSLCKMRPLELILWRGETKRQVAEMGSIEKTMGGGRGYIAPPDSSTNCQEIQVYKGWAPLWQVHGRPVQDHPLFVFFFML